MSRDKGAVVAALRAGLEAELDAATAVAQMASDEATHAESKAENKYDTRGTEASYLAAGQARRVAELRQLVAWFERLVARRMTVAGAGALVHVSDDGGDRWCLLAPGGGGASVDVGGEVQLISVTSPLGRALLGLEEGDDGEWDTPGGLRSVEVVEVL